MQTFPHHSNKGLFTWRFLLISLVFAFVSFFIPVIDAQPKYGINSITTVAPPYPITLDGFVAEGGTKISLQILPTDINISQYPVLLKLVISGNGITIESKSLMIHEPVYLNGNEFVTLNGSDLQAFFNPDNLNFSGYSKTQYQRNGRLPEGVYTVGFELYDVIRKIPVASVRSTVVFLFLNEVPALNLPNNGGMISAAGTQTLNFRWTTRHSPLAATFFTPEYLFELWEITPEGHNAYDVVRGTRPLYVITLSSPYLAYGIAEPQLQPGKSYAWRVRESDPEGRTLFKNDGYTEVYTFTYGRNCPAPELSADKAGTSHLSVTWKADISQKQFELRYRDKKKKNAEWYTLSSNLLSGKVDNLKSNTVYEVEVCAICGDQRSEYSNRLEINTRQNTSFKCGQVDSSKMPQNKAPLRKLSGGDVFNAYGFDVQVKEAAGGAGTYTGKGYVLVPLLNFIKIEVKFDNIQLNEEYQLIGGEVRTVYNLKNSLVYVPGQGVLGLSEINDLAKAITGDKEKNNFDEVANKTVEVDSVKEIKIEGDKIIITDVNGKIEEVSTTSNKIIAVTADDGKEYVVDTGTGTIYSSGNSGQKAASGTPIGSVTTAAQAGKGSSPKYNVSFVPHQLQECGFDYPTTKSPAANYEQVEITGNPALVPWKSIQAGHIERIVADITGGPADSVRYYRESNNVVMTTPGEKATQQQIMLNGLGKNDEDKLFAWYAAYNQGDTSKTYARVLAGQLNTVSYEKKLIKVVLVPVNGSSCPDAGYVATELNKIYKSAVVEWDVLSGKNIAVTFKDVANAVFDNTDPDSRMDYTDDMKAAISVLKDDPQHNRETYYLFFLDKAKDLSVKGYMPLKGQFGFIFKYKQYPDEYLRTIAHELGHGPFRLWHTFSNSNKYIQSQGSTDNLMDYAAASATNLNKYQWDWVHDPEWRIYWGEEEGEGESVRTDTSTIGTWKDIFPKLTDLELSKISRIYDTVAIKFDSLNINSATKDIYFKGDIKDWSVRKSSHSRKLKQVAINIATKDNPDYSQVDPKEIYIENYIYETKIDTVKWTHNTNVALHSYVNAFNFTKPKITSLDKLKDITTIKVATFKLKSNNSTELGYIAPLDYNGVPSNDPKYTSLSSYRIDDYALIAFYSGSGSNPDFVFQLIPERSTKDYEVASWLKHLDILNDTTSSITLTTTQLAQIFPNADTARIREVVNAINKYSADFNINTLERMSHFLGQIGAETTSGGKPLSALVESCNYTENIIKNAKEQPFAKRVTSPNITSNGKTFSPLLNPDLFVGFSGTNYYFLNDKGIKYDTIYYLKNNVFDSTSVKYAYSGQGIKNNYLNGNGNCAFFTYVYCCNKSGLGNGNVASGDGALFRGRGFVHLTGRSNYETRFYNYWKKEYPSDKRTLEQIVSLLETGVDLAMKVSMIFWKYNGINQTINSLSFDSNNDEIRQVSILVNGGKENKKKEDIAGYTTRETNTINAYKVLSKK